MTERKTRTKKDQHERPSTQAGENFGANLAQISLLISILPVELKRRVLRPTSSVLRRVSQAKKHASEGDNSQGKVRFEGKWLEREASKFTTGVATYIQLQQMICEWSAVMLVTFIEAYVEEGLMLIATKNQDWVKDAELPLDYETVFEADSIEGLKNELRRRWANKTVKGGPEKWFTRLQRMGAEEYSDDCRFRLQHLWDTRNLIVHAQAKVSPAYLKKYQHKIGLKAGDRIRVNGNTVVWWNQGMKDFFEPTDRFFARYSG
jgi:hypothetical protein